MLYARPDPVTRRSCVKPGGKSREAAGGAPRTGAAVERIELREALSTPRQRQPSAVRKPCTAIPGVKAEAQGSLDQPNERTSAVGRPRYVAASNAWVITQTMAGPRVEIDACRMGMGLITRETTRNRQLPS